MTKTTNGTPIIVYRDLITLTDSADGGIFLSYLMSCSEKISGDWFVKTREQCWQATGIKKDRQQALCKQLMQLGFIETKIKGLPARTHYRVAGDLVKQKMAALQDTRAN